MAKKVFYSFHYERDSWRVQQVSQMGKLEGQPILSGQAWEEVKGGGPTAIKKWIGEKMSGKSCLVCLIGSQTANRDWVQYEIEKAWKDGLGVVGVYIHGLKDASEKQDSKGTNPFSKVTIKIDGVSKNLSSIVTAYDPPYKVSDNVYNDISEKLTDLVSAAITLRGKYA
jgi:hypothetical protein